MCECILGPWSLGVTAPSTRPPIPVMSCLQTMMMNIQDVWDGQMRLVLEEIARDYQLDSRKLVGKYILRGLPDLSPQTLKAYPEAQGPVEIPKPRAPVAEKKKGGRRPKFHEKPCLDGELSREFMTDLTIPLLKEACKMRRIALTGNKEALIARMLEYQRDPQAHKPPRKGGRKKKEQAPEPQHNHSLDDKTHPDCEQCKTYGNPMDPEMAEEEFEVTQDIQNQLQDIVKKMNATTVEDPEESHDAEKPYDVFGLQEGQETKAPSDDEEDWEEYKEPPEDDDPLANMEYGDELEMEE